MKPTRVIEYLLYVLYIITYSSYNSPVITFTPDYSLWSQAWRIWNARVSRALLEKCSWWLKKNLSPVFEAWKASLSRGTRVSSLGTSKFAPRKGKAVCDSADNLYCATIFSLGLVSRIPGIHKHTCIFYLLMPSIQDTGGRNSELLPNRIVTEKNKVWTKHCERYWDWVQNILIQGILLSVLFSLSCFFVSQEVPRCFSFFLNGLLPICP